MVNFTVERYLYQVRKKLPISRKEKKRITEALKRNVMEYVGENPSADYAALIKRFGTPQSISGAYVENLESDVLLKDLRNKRKVLRVVSVVAAAIVVVWMAVAGAALLDSYEQSGGYSKTYIVDGSGESDEMGE